MHAHHLTAIIVILSLALLIQTARAAYFRGLVKQGGNHMDDLTEEIEHTRLNLNEAKDAVTKRDVFIREQYERLTMRQAAPAGMDELIAANGLLRSLNAVVEREGENTNWEGLERQLTERLEAQRTMIYGTPAL